MEDASTMNPLNQSGIQGAQPYVDRPEMPAGYGLASGRKGLLTWQQVAEQLEQARNYWVCSTRPDGRPHAIPVWGLWLDGRFYFGTDPASRKGRNLAANPAVVVHLESGDDVVIIEGIAERISDDALSERLTALYDAKYAVPATPDHAVRPQTVLAWQEHDFPNTATRFQFLAD